MQSITKKGRVEAFFKSEAGSSDSRKRKRVVLVLSAHHVDDEVWNCLHYYHEGRVANALAAAKQKQLGSSSASSSSKKVPITQPSVALTPALLKQYQEEFMLMPTGMDVHCKEYDYVWRAKKEQNLDLPLPPDRKKKKAAAAAAAASSTESSSE